MLSVDIVVLKTSIFIFVEIVWKILPIQKHSPLKVLVVIVLSVPFVKTS